MYLNRKHGTLDELACSLKSEYTQNVPFPHVVIDDFFREDFLSGVLDDFSDLSKENTNNAAKSNNQPKLPATPRPQSEHKHHMVLLQPLMVRLQILMVITQ